VTGEEIEPEEGEVNEFCSTNFSEAVAQDKTVAPEVHENLKVLTDTAEAIKSGSLEEVNKSFDKLDELEKKNKNFAAITACAMMCFSEICKECGQVIPGTEDKVETSAEDVKTPEGEVTTESTEATTEVPSDKKVDEALEKADDEDEVEPPTDEEIIMNFAQELTTLMDGEF
jgi:glyceraldehyde-3-phosphate dehydrogenase/erythrose-4-phosphate dehydrogenase